MAGERGLEPRVTVLETVGLPLTDSPICFSPYRCRKTNIVKTAALLYISFEAVQSKVRNDGLLAAMTGLEPMMTESKSVVLPTTPHRYINLK